ncbi:MAG: gamma-glutamyltransferase [Woeseiaceae bacterium]|nr:gamma-glutamyltransferase [Woeseiaceae bacterium]
MNEFKYAMTVWRFGTRFALGLAATLLLGCHSETSTAASDVETGWPHGAMISAANPHAAEAGASMLERGGHAIDAAIAAHAVLGLVEPQSSGIGGGAFLLTYDRASGDLTYLDGREMAPAGATADMFMQDGEVMGFIDAWQSGLAVGVPGTIALYKRAHDEYGKLPWEDLFDPAIELAENGFHVSPRLAGFLVRLQDVGRLSINPDTAAYFYPGGEPLAEGQLLVNVEYANTLRRIATEGPAAFYEGEIPESIVAAASQPPNPGSLSLDDFANYRVIERPVVCGTFRVYRICTTTPPSSGGAQIMIAGIYDHLVDDDSSDMGRIAAFVDAQRLAYADRDYYFGDPDAVNVSLEDLLNPVYLRHRADNRFAPDEPVSPGNPALVLNGSGALQFAPDTTEEASGTSHLSIIDLDGNAVGMTATIEGIFGSSRWAHGFLLNNQMTDFAREFDADAPPQANAVRPGARPRSSMSPTMIFDEDGALLMITGSPGGNSIPAYVAKSILGTLDWSLSPQEALDHSNIVARGDTVRVEISVEPGPEVAEYLKQLGYAVEEREGENSGLHVILVEADGLVGAADKRREGEVIAVP